MASAKSVEDMLLCSDIDAVNALVGSLESQLSQPAAAYVKSDGTPNSVITNPQFADNNFRTLSSAQKHGALLGSLLDRGNTNSSKTFMGSQPVVMSPVPVMVSGTGPPSTGGFANNTYGQSSQQTLLNSPAVSNADIKVVYTIHSAVPLSSTVSTGVANTTQFPRNNVKLQNGNPNALNTGIVMTSGGLVRNGPTVVCQNNTVNLASAVTVTQPQISNTSPAPFQGSMPPQHSNHTSQPNNTPSNLNSGKAANAKDSHVQQNSPQPASFIQVSQSIANPQPANFQNVNSQPTVISTSKCSPAHGTPVNVMTQVMTNQHSVQGIQVVNVNPTRFASSTVQRTLAPRVVIGNQIRIAPQVMRHGNMPVPIPGQNAIAIPPGLRGTIYVKTENGQLQVLNIGPGIQSAMAPTSGATAYRFQSVHPNSAGGIRTLVPQQVNTTTAAGIKTAQAISRTSSPQSISSSIIKQAVPIASIPTSSVTPRTGSPLQAPAQASTAKMSSETVKQKCRNFLSTLMKLAAEQPRKVAVNVKKLIQSLIDGTVPPEEFTTRLQKELNSSPQPCLVPFLKKSLPYLRHSLVTKEVTIEGVNPPPPSAYMMPAFSTSQIRPVLSQISTPVIVTSSVSSTVGSVLTAQLSQPSGVLHHQMLNTPRLIHTVTNQNAPRATIATNFSSLAAKPVSGVSAAAAAAFSSLPKVSPTKPSVLKSSAIKDKRVAAPVRDEDDINDVAAMGGVNLIEESQKILATNSELVGTQIRSCKDDNYLLGSSLQNKIAHLVRKHGLHDVSSDSIALISHAAQERLKTLVERLGIIAEHRTENMKMDNRFEVSQDIRTQIKFLEELDKLEKKKHEEQEREILLRAAKSRSKLEDPEQLKLKQKAKEMQKAEIEELRQREANMTALLAIGPRKKMKMESGSLAASPLGFSGSSSSSSSVGKPLVRPRVKRVNMRDLLFVMEQDRDPKLKSILFKSHVK